MFNRRVHRDLEGVCRDHVFAGTLCPLRFIILLLFFANVSFAQSQYDINDPRNPDCPCHKLQKIADEEYASSEIRLPNISIGGSATMYHKKKKGVRMKKGKRHFRNRHLGLKKVRTDYSVCFRW